MKDSRLTNAGVSGYNKPKRTPSHATKSHVVVAKEGEQIKTIRFGQQGVTGPAGSGKTKIAGVIAHTMRNLGILLRQNVNMATKHPWLEKYPINNDSKYLIIGILES